MKNPDMGSENADGVRFCTAEEVFRETLAAAAGKVLVVCDASALGAAKFAAAPRAVACVLDDGDALPLFSMPDGVGCVVAAGGRDTIVAARYFAEIRRVPCTVIPASAALDGVRGRWADVLLGGSRLFSPLAPCGSVVCDAALLAPSRARAWSRLALTRLALFEERALARFGRRDSGLGERAFAALDGTDGTTESLVRCHDALRRLEAEGLPAGEGTVLAAAAGGLLPEWAAYRALFALYTAFFRFGVPRSYLVPDYAARAKRAGTPPVAVPSAEECARRAALLGAMRARCNGELEVVARKEGAVARAVRAACPALPPPVRAETLARLPELAPAGLSAIVRDFGLMEF